jgi:DNA-binding CsgD family transcriptional regulator
LSTRAIEALRAVAASLGTLALAHVDDELEEALSYSEEMQADYARLQLGGHRCYFLELRGEWDAALAESSRLIEVGGEPVALIRPRTVEGSVRVRRGDDSGLALVQQAHDIAGPLLDIQRLGPVTSALAELQWLGKADASSDILDAAELARVGGHVRHHAELSVRCRRLGVDGPDPPKKGPAPLLAELRGDWQAAASAWEEMGLPYYRALTLAFSDDPDAMREAVVEATRLGASTTADQIRARQRELGHGVSRGPGRATLANPGGLTTRQVEVVKLLAVGLTNREIADRLFDSPKTVDHHVSAILTSLRVETRRSAGDWAIDQGFAAPN